MIFDMYILPALAYAFAISVTMLAIWFANWRGKLKKCYDCNCERKKK